MSLSRQTVVSIFSSRCHSFLQSPRAKEPELLGLGRVATLEVRQVATEGTPETFGEAGDDLVFIMGPPSVASLGNFSNCVLTTYAFSV